MGILSTSSYLETYWRPLFQKNPSYAPLFYFSELSHFPDCCSYHCSSFWYFHYCSPQFKCGELYTLWFRYIYGIIDSHSWIFMIIFIIRFLHCMYCSFFWEKWKLETSLLFYSTTFCIPIFHVLYQHQITLERSQMKYYRMGEIRTKWNSENKIRLSFAWRRKINILTKILCILDFTTFSYYS